MTRARPDLSPISTISVPKTILELACKSVCLPFEAARNKVELHAHDRLERRQHPLKHTVNNGRNSIYARWSRTWKSRNATILGGRDATAAGKSKVKELRGREKRQDREGVDLGNAQELGGVHVVPMSEFVG